MLCKQLLFQSRLHQRPPSTFKICQKKRALAIALLRAQQRSNCVYGRWRGSNQDYTNLHPSDATPSGAASSEPPRTARAFCSPLDPLHPARDNPASGPDSRLTLSAFRRATSEALESAESEPQCVLPGSPYVFQPVAVGGTPGQGRRAASERLESAGPERHVSSNVRVRAQSLQPV